MIDALFTLAASPADHVRNHSMVTTDAIKILDEPLWVWSGQLGNLILSGIILYFGMSWVARHVATGPESQGTDRYVTRNKAAHLIEIVCVYLRDEICQPLLKDRTSKMMPFLWTIFFFILINNMLGLVPLMDTQHIFSKYLNVFGGTATSNLWVTGALALIAGIFFNVAAIKRLGVGGFLHHLTGGSPWFIWPIMIPIEFFGQFLIKPVALAIRLFANMTAGHILLATLLSFIAAIWTSDSGFALAGGVTIVSLIGATAIYFLEIFVGFLQAFIFTFLTAVFISLMDHHGDHEHDESHEHAPAPAH